MFKANYKSKIIYSFDIMNIHNKKIHEIEEQYRYAGRNDELTCVECGQPVILKSGQVNVPHFAHVIKTSYCTVDKRKSFESEDHKRGVQLLFNFFKEKAVYDLIDIDYKLDFHKRANVYVKGTTQLAVEYVANPIAYLQWLDKNEAYINHDIIPLWVLSRNKFEEMSHKDYNFFELTTALTNKDGILFTLNTDDGDLSLAKYMTYIYKDEIYKRRIFKEKIQLSKMILDDNNEFDVTNYLKAYDQAYQVFKDKVDKEIEVKEKLEQKAQEKEKKAQEVRDKYRTDDNTSRSIDGKWGTCKYCGRYTNKWRAYLGDGVVICYCDED